MIRSNKKIFFLLGILVLTGFHITFSPQKALAAQGPAGIPGTVQTRLADSCATSGYVASQSSWLSTSSNTLVSSQSIPANQVVTLNLKWNRVAKKCPGRSLGSLLATNFIVHAVSPIIPSLFLQTGAVTYAGMTDALPYSVASTDFTYTVGPFATSQNLTIGILSKGINWNGGSSFQCIRRVGTTAPADSIPGSFGDFNACNDIGSALADFWVDVYPSLPGPVQTITNTCTGIKVSTNGMRVDVYKNSISPPNGLGSMTPPDQDFNLAARGISPGQLLQVAAIGDGVNTVGNKVDAFTWTLPSSCGFTLVPVPNVPLLEDDDEDPNRVSYSGAVNLAASSGVASVPGVEVVTDYYIMKNGVKLPNQPIPGATLANQTISNGYAVNSGPAGLSGLKAGDEVCWTIKVTPSSGSVDSVGNIIIASPAPSATSAPACKPIVDKPYLSFLGGDVAVGGDFSTGVGTCVNIGADIKTFSKSGGLGSGVEFAAMAFGSGVISSFATAQNHDAPDSLAFANDSATLGAFGGKHCIKDYYADATKPSVIPKAGSTILVDDLTTGNFRYDAGGGTYSLHGNLPNAVRARIYIDGNLIIDGSVNYASTSWGSIAEIPSLHVYVRGNIYIKNTVGSMVGMYVAQPRPAPATNTGEIITCTDGSGTAIAAANLFDDCGSQLKVRGALVAGQIKWLRTANSLRNAGAGDATFGSNRGAEVVELSPEFLMVAPPNPVPEPGKGYQYFTTLPPVL